MNVSVGLSGASAFSALSDVTISSPTNGQVPVYNSGTGKWENSTVSATNNFAGTYCGINSSQTITANTLTDVLWDEIISETANLSHTTGNATFTSNLTQKYDIDIVIVPQTANASYANGAYLQLVVDGTVVAKQPHSLYNDSGSNWVNPIFVIMTTEAIAATKTFKVQFFPGAISNADLLGKDSAAYRCTLRVRERGV